MADGDARLTVVLDAKIDSLIEKLAQTERRLGQFGQTASATAQKVRNDLDRMGGTRVAEQLKAIELANKLAVAQAAGNTKEATALQQQITLQRQINDLKRLGLSETEAQAAAEKQLAAIQAARAGRKGFGAAGAAIGGALDAKVLEEGAGKVGVLGAGLEALGGAGLAAAGGIAAAAAAGEAFNKFMETTGGAVEYAAHIEVLSKQIGVTTDYIQEFNFAAKQSDIDVGEADAALQGFNQALGAVQGNLPRAKMLATVFADALNLTPEQLRGYHDVADLLPVIADRIQHAGSAAEQAAIAKKLGMEALLPLLKQGSAGVNELTQRARDLGLVMDPGLVKAGASAKEKLNELDDTMRARTNIAFVQFAGTLVAIKTAFLNAEIAGLHFLSVITGTQPAQERMRNNQQQIDEVTKRTVASMKYLATLAPGSSERARVQADLATDAKDLADLAKMQRGIATELTPAPEVPAAGGTQFIPDKTPKAHEAALKGEDVDALVAKAGEDLAEARKAQAEVIKSGTTDLARQAQAEIAANDEAAAVQQAKLTKDRQTLLASEKIEGPQSDALQKQIEQAQAITEQTRLMKDAVILQQEENRVRAQRLAAEQAMNQLLDQTDDIRAQLAQTTAERVSIERAKFERDQADARDQFNEQNRKDLAAGADPLDIAQRQGAFANLQAAQQAQFGEAHESPLEKFVTDQQKAAKDIGTTWQTEAVQAMTDFNQQLTQAIVNGKGLGDVFHSMLQKLESDLIQVALQAAESAALSSLFGIGTGGPGLFGNLFSGVALPGHAEGTASARGGYAMVGEKGPEIVKLPAGAQVIPNRDLVSPMRGISGPSAMQRQASSSIYVTNDLRGVATDQALDTKIAVANQRTAAAVYESVKRAMPGWQVDYQYQRA